MYKNSLLFMSKTPKSKSSSRNHTAKALDMILEDSQLNEEDLLEAPSRKSRSYFKWSFGFQKAARFIQQKYIGMRNNILIHMIQHGWDMSLPSLSWVHKVKSSAFGMLKDYYCWIIIQYNYDYNSVFTITILLQTFANIFHQVIAPDHKSIFTTAKLNEVCISWSSAVFTRFSSIWLSVLTS